MAYPKGEKRYRIAFPLLILTDLLMLVPPRLMAILIDELSNGMATIDGLEKVVGLIVVSTLLVYVLNYLWQVHLFDASDTLGATLRSKLMEHFFTEDPVFYERFGSGDLMNRVTGDIESVTEMAGFGVMCLADGLVMPIFLVIVMIATTSWKLTLASIAPFLLLLRDQTARQCRVQKISRGGGGEECLKRSRRGECRGCARRARVRHGRTRESEVCRACACDL